MGPSQVLCVDDAGTHVLAGLQLHGGDEPAAGAARVVAERGAVRALGVFGVNDGCAPVADGLLSRLQVHLGLVAPPGAVPHGHHRLAVGDGRGERSAVHLVPEVSVRVVFDLRVAPAGRRDAAVRRGPLGGRVETLWGKDTAGPGLPYLISCSGLGLTSMLSPKKTGCMRVLESDPVEFSSRYGSCRQEADIDFVYLQNSNKTKTWCLCSWSSSAKRRASSS